MTTLTKAAVTTILPVKDMGRARRFYADQLGLEPKGFAADGNFLFVADTVNDRIRRIDLIAGKVETFSGNGNVGSEGGPAHVATFVQPIALAFDADGILYVSDVGLHSVRRIDTNGSVSEFAGGGSSKFRDGTGVTARFDSPRGLAIDIPGRVLYVADTENFRIRRVALN